MIVGSAFEIRRVGHIGIHCTNVDRSIAWYRDVLGLTLTGHWGSAERGMAFMRFTDDHHNVVLFTHPTAVSEESRDMGFNGLNHIAFEVENRDEWLKALADLRGKGVEIIQGPLVHGPEGGTGPGTAYGGSGSRSFYFLDPDGNRLEIYTDMMKVPYSEPFPRPEYAEQFAEVFRREATVEAGAGARF
jgi:catechol 2,3-dioxygenase-like lactoylglutathione lyase family enzyme